MGALRGVLVVSLTAFWICRAEADLIVTEIMYDPNSPDSSWEWIEIFNDGVSSVELDGYVFDDEAGAPLNSANISSGTISAGGLAVLYDAALDASDFEAAWESGAPGGLDINLVAVSSWPALNNGGDHIGLWDSFANYSGQNFANAIEQVTYDVGGDWPSNNNSASIYLTDPSADKNAGTSWALSGESTFGWQSASGAGNGGKDFGSPGAATPEPSTLLLVGLAAVAAVGVHVLRRKSTAVGPV